MPLAIRLDLEVEKNIAEVPVDKLGKRIGLGLNTDAAMAEGMDKIGYPFA